MLKLQLVARQHSLEFKRVAGLAFQESLKFSAE